MALLAAVASTRLFDLHIIVIVHQHHHQHHHHHHQTIKVSYLQSDHHHPHLLRISISILAPCHTHLIITIIIFSLSSIIFINHIDDHLLRFELSAFS